MTESKIVTAVGISVTTPLGAEANRRLEQAMADEVLRCNTEGISTEECHAGTLRARMQAAYARELEKIERGRLGMSISRMRSRGA